MNTIYAFILVLFVNSALLAQTPQGKSIEPSKTLQILSIITETTDFIEKWQQKPSEFAPHVATINEVVPNQTFHIAFIVSGYSTQQSRCNFSVHFKLFKPDGSIMFDQEDYAKYNGVAPPIPAFIMADPAVDLTFENQDPIGTYKLISVVEDKVLQTRSQTENLITLVKPIEKQAPPLKKKESQLSPAKSTYELDSLWLDYANSNKAQPLICIYKTVAYYSERDNQQIFVVGAAAKQSLIANGKKSKAIKEILKVLQDKSQGYMKDQVSDILKKIDEDKGLENCTEETKAIMTQIVQKNRK